MEAWKVEKNIGFLFDLIQTRPQKGRIYQEKVYLEEEIKEDDEMKLNKKLT